MKPTKSLLMFSTSALIIATLTTLSTEAIAIPGRWIEDASGCKAWDEAPQAGESIKWAGQCVAGKVSGEGTLEWMVNGELVERDQGTFVAGRTTHGTTEFFRGGQLFERDQGTDVAGRPTQGTAEIFMNGALVLRKTGAIWGPGQAKIEQFANGALAWTYAGPVLNGTMHGSGVVTFPNGARVAGPFVNGERHGTFTETWSDGRTFSGAYVHNVASAALEAQFAHARQQDAQGQTSGYSGAGSSGTHQPPLRQQPSATSGAAEASTPKRTFPVMYGTVTDVQRGTILDAASPFVGTTRWTIQAFTRADKSTPVDIICALYAGTVGAADPISQDSGTSCSVELTARVPLQGFKLAIRRHQGNSGFYYVVTSALY